MISCTVLKRYVVVALGLAAVTVPPWSYQGSDQIIDSCKQDSSAEQYDKAAFAFSCIGAYQQALLYNDRDYLPRWTRKGVVTAIDSLFLSDCRPLNARKYIVQQARNKQLVIINEAHHTPLHRVFTTSLLQDLYQAGFRYLGAETLNFRDSTLNDRTYPVLNSGYYTREPQYGNLIREALRIGYRVFPYEAVTKDEFASGKSREMAQARRIGNVLQRDRNAKILIHCGYDHVVEVPLSNSWQKAMAGWLKEFTGLDPLTIDQQQWTELSQPAKEHPLYRAMSLKEPTVFVNSTGEAYPGLNRGRTDLQVAHPRTYYTYGRPNWLLRGRWKPYFLQCAQCTLQLPCLVLAYRAGEQINPVQADEQAVPVDIVELTNWTEKKALILPPGHYQLVLQNSAGNRQVVAITQK